MWNLHKATHCTCSLNIETEELLYKVALFESIAYEMRYMGLAIFTKLRTKEGERNK